MKSAPPTAAVADSPHTVNIDRRRKRRRDSRSCAISAASAPPPCKISYCCGVRGGLLVIFMMIYFLLFSADQCRSQRRCLATRHNKRYSTESRSTSTELCNSSLALHWEAPRQNYV